MNFLELIKINDSLFFGIAIWGIAVLILFVMFGKRATIAQFTREVISELRKATWPWDPKEKSIGAKYKELIDSTVVVIIAMILLAAAVSLIDFALLGITRAIF